MAGDYILSIASIMISRLRSDDVTIVLSQVSFTHVPLVRLTLGQFELYMKKRRRRKHKYKLKEVISIHIVIIFKYILNCYLAYIKRSLYQTLISYNQLYIAVFVKMCD